MKDINSAEFLFIDHSCFSFHSIRYTENVRIQTDGFLVEPSFTFGLEIGSIASPVVANSIADLQRTGRNEHAGKRFGVEGEVRRLRDVASRGIETQSRADVHA